MTTLLPAQARANVHIAAVQPRATAPDAGERFREALGQGASGLIRGVEAAVSVVPGGGAITAAVRAASQGAGAPAGASGAAGTSGGSFQTALGEQSLQAMELLEMQQQMSMEQRQFQTVSNVMKARHDTAKAVIQNVR
ncbi:MAG: hypothetical protein AAF411_21690 [Myxococcota bacterium]